MMNANTQFNLLFALKVWYCLNSVWKRRLDVFAQVTSQPAHDVKGASPEGSLKVLTSGTYKGPSKDSQGTNTKTDDVMKKLFFRSNSPSITYLFLFSTGRTNIQVLNGDVRGTSTGPSCGTSWRQNDGTFLWRPWDGGHTCFLNSTHKHIKLTSTGYSRLYSEW